MDGGLEPNLSVTCIIAVLGAPASGKGTICNLLAKDPRLRPLFHFSAGDFLRATRSSTVEADIARGTVMKGEEIVPLLGRHIRSQLFAATFASSQTEDGQVDVGILLDGFPRSLDQEQAARESDLAVGREFPDLVLYLACPKEVLKRRFVERGRTEGDDAERFERRWGQNEREGLAVVERYRERGILVEVDTSGSDKESYRKVVEALRASHLAKVLFRKEAD